MAQNVSISGILDTGIGNDSITNGVLTRKTSNTGLASRNSTSNIAFSGTEDLGGGMKASFFMNQSMNSGSGALGVRDTWAAISGGFGELKIGRYTPGFETITGSYSQGGGTSNTAGTADFMFGSAIQDNAAATLTSAPQALYTEIGRGGAGATGHIQFTTPTMSGLSAVVGYGKASNDNSNTGNRLGLRNLRQALILSLAPCQSVAVWFVQTPLPRITRQLNATSS